MSRRRSAARWCSKPSICTTRESPIKPSTGCPSIHTCWRTTTRARRMPRMKCVSSPESERMDAADASAAASVLRQATRARIADSVMPRRIADSHTARASPGARQCATWNSTFRMGSSVALRAIGAGPVPQWSRSPAWSSRDDVPGTATWISVPAGTQRPRSAAAVTHVARPPTRAAATRRASHSGVSSHDLRTRLSSPRCTAEAISDAEKPSARTVALWATPSRARIQSKSWSARPLGSATGMGIAEACAPGVASIRIVAADCAQLPRERGCGGADSLT